MGICCLYFSWFRGFSQLRSLSRYWCICSLFSRDMTQVVKGHIRFLSSSCIFNNHSLYYFFLKVLFFTFSFKIQDVKAKMKEVEDELVKVHVGYFNFIVLVLWFLFLVLIVCFLFLMCRKKRKETKRIVRWMLLSLQRLGLETLTQESNKFVLENNNIHYSYLNNFLKIHLFFPNTDIMQLFYYFIVIWIHTPN